MVSSHLLVNNEGEIFQGATLYKSVIGALQYATITRPEIFVENKLSQFLQEPTNLHWQATKRVLRSLKGTINYGLKVHFGGRFELE